MPGRDTLIGRCADALNRIDDAQGAIGGQLDRGRFDADALDAVGEIRAAADDLERDLRVLVREG